MFSFLLSIPSLYFHPDTWEKPLISHGNYQGLRLYRLATLE